MDMDEWKNRQHEMPHGVLVRSMFFFQWKSRLTVSSTRISFRIRRTRKLRWCWIELWWFEYSENQSSVFVFKMKRIDVKSLIFVWFRWQMWRLWRRFYGSKRSWRGRKICNKYYCSSLCHRIVDRCEDFGNFQRYWFNEKNESFSIEF